DRGDRLRVSLEPPQLLADRDVQKADSGAVDRRRQRSAVGREAGDEGCRLLGRDAVQFLAGGEIPDAHRAVEARRDDPPALRWGPPAPGGSGPVPGRATTPGGGGRAGPPGAPFTATANSSAGGGWVSAPAPSAATPSTSSTPKTSFPLLMPVAPATSPASCAA